MASLRGYPATIVVITNQNSLERGCFLLCYLSQVGIKRKQQHDDSERTAEITIAFGDLEPRPGENKSKAEIFEKGVPRS